MTPDQERKLDDTREAVLLLNQSITGRGGAFDRLDQAEKDIEKLKQDANIESGEFAKFKAQVLLVATAGAAVLTTVWNKIFEWFTNR